MMRRGERHDIAFDIEQYLNTETKDKSTWTVLGKNDKIIVCIKRNQEVLTK